MGEVYRAEDTKLHREVAVKVLPSIVADDPARLARFHREAQVLASLNHPNIAAIYGLEEADDVRALILELVEGPTLAERMARSQPSLEESLEICKEIAEALETAHERGVVHRDLKPSNIKIAPDGKVKLLDFGLAKAMAEPVSEERSSAPTMMKDITGDGIMLGTAPYMSPEQARGKETDQKTDIWAFGCVLFELLTGSRAFRGDSVADTVAAIIERDPDWNALPSELDPRIVDLLHRCLRKDPGMRLQHVGDARILISEVRSGTEAPATRILGESSPRPETGPVANKERFVWIAGIILVAMVTAVATRMLSRGEPPAAPVRSLTIGTATPTGVYYPFGVGIGKVIERTIPNTSVRVLDTEGSFENARLLDGGMIDLAMIQNDVAFNSVKTERVLGHQSTKIKGLAVLYDEIAQIIVSTDSGIEAIADLEGKPVSLGPEDGGGRFSSEILLEHFGVTEGRFTPLYLDTEESLAGVIDGSIAAMIIWRAIPAPFLQDAFMEGRIALLSVNPAKIEGLRINQPFIVASTIPAQVYPSQDAPVTTVAVKAMLAGSSELEPQLVEEILEAIFGHIPDLMAHHPRAADLSVDTAYRLEDGMPIELHPGAVAFYNR